MTLLTDKQAASPSVSKSNRLTYRQYLADTSEQNNHTEWVDGEIIHMAPISGEHTDVVVGSSACCERL